MAASSMADPAKPTPILPGIADPYRRLVETVQDYAIFLLDASGHVVSWGPGAERLKGYAHADIIGQHFSVFYPPEERARGVPKEVLRVAAADGRFEDEGWRLRKDGSRFWANVVITALRDDAGVVRGFAKITRDLSDQRRIEALEKSQRQTNEFLAMLAHELRNPLAPIRNALHLLSKKPTSDASELWVRDVLQRQTTQMTRLVDDLLDVSRMTRSTVALNRAKADIGRVVREAVDASRQWIEARQHTLEVRVPAERLDIELDAVRINQVMQNLIHNAAKFTPNGGTVIVSAAREGDAVVLSVKDNGAGMTEELCTTAFELFKQGQQGLDRAEGGLGVGLTLVQRLVMLHGGSVEARSDGPGKGSEFVVRLPLHQPQDGPAPLSSIPTGASLPGHRILVVDDNVDAANALRYLLENDGHEVKIAADGAAGLTLARQFCPHFLLLDIGLPKLDGYEFARQVRADEALRRTTIIAVTGYGQPEDRRRAVEAGFDYHLTKPVEFPSLQRLLRVAS